ncbi:MAG: DUF2163 domain-containing protein [Paracoccaceae bacterium]
MTGAVTTRCRAWRIVRADGTALGFTDHDAALTVEGLTCRPGTGLEGRAVATSTGLSVDNAEALGILSDEAVNAADIAAGRYDGAAVTVWDVDWSDPRDARTVFAGTVGEIRRAGDRFEVELRGPAEALGVERGRLYQPLCDAEFGDGRCRADLSAFQRDTVIRSVDADPMVMIVDQVSADWRRFDLGSVEVLSGAARGCVMPIATDRATAQRRRLTLRLAPPLPVAVGDRVRLTFGCDKRFGTCRARFDNAVNFQGFPDVPGEDWLSRVPRRDRPAKGGSLR